MKKQKHYLTAEMILKDIDDALRKIGRLQSKAGEHSALASFYLLGGTHTDYVRHMDEVGVLLKKIERLRNARLKKLQNTLTAFQTQPLFGDAQVVLQPV